MPAVRKLIAPRGVICGDCITTMRQMPGSFASAVVTDPPYGLEIANQSWDTIGDFQAFSTSWSREAFRILKPGGHLLAFGGTRQWHRLAMGIEAAGFELRDTLMWLYGKGCPKNMSLDKQIDRHLGAEREVIGIRDPRATHDTGRMRPSQALSTRRVRAERTGAVRDLGRQSITKPATPEARQWEGWGTNLKPAWEPILVFRRPCEGTASQNVLRHGVAGFNVKACAVRNGAAVTDRFPSNLLIDELVSQDLDLGTGRRPPSQYFYCAKPTLAERTAGLRGADNPHPTVKPLALMRWLVRLVTPAGGCVVDPFVGSGTTGVAAKAEDRNFCGIELNPDFSALAIQRIQAWTP